MHTRAEAVDPAIQYPVSVTVRPDMEDRNRLTAFFRFFLALPHIILVGGPVAIFSASDWTTESGAHFGYGSGGMLGAVAFFGAVIAWFAILFTARYPGGLRKLMVYYLRWRLRAVAYMTLLRDEYPPFGEGDYPADLAVPEQEEPRDRVSVAFRLIFAIPHIIVLWFLGVAWAVTTALGWAAILLTGKYPAPLYGFALGVLAWTVRVEAYVLLLRDEYPPFSLRS